MVKMLIVKNNTNIDRYIKNNNILLNNGFFNDTNDKDIFLANSLGIVQGIGNNKFAFQNNITHQEVAIMIKNLSKIINTKVINRNNKYNDHDVISQWAKESIYYVRNISDVNNNYVMSGIGDNKFDPKGYYTVEQAIAAIYRLYVSD